MDGVVRNAHVPVDFDDGGYEPFGPADVHVALLQVRDQPGQRFIVDDGVVPGTATFVDRAAAVSDKLPALLV
ncbi:MAG: hypothetical protein ACR2MP_25925, partial [Streptosporangiaceae bacterium]